MLLFLFAFVFFAFLAVLVIVGTIGLTLASLATLLTAPAQLRGILRDRRLRRNHALEHATINVIEERLGSSRLAGLAEPGGFVIRGGASPELVASAAQEALARLRAGERRLALHPRCGTTLIAAQLTLALTFLVLMIVLRELSWLPFVAGLLAAALLGPRLSLLLQRYVTTDTSVQSTSITGVEVRPPAGRFGMVSMFVLGPVFVHTEESAPGQRIDERNAGRVTVITGEREEVPAGDFRVR